MSQQSIDSVRQTEQFGPIKAMPARDRIAGAITADMLLPDRNWTGDRDAFEAWAATEEGLASQAELAVRLSMLGLLPNEPPPARKESLHGSDQLYKAGCRCVPCRHAHNSVIRQARYKATHGGGPR